MIGYSPKNKIYFYDLEHKDYGFLEAIPAGIVTGTKTLGNYVKSLSLIFNKEGAKQIGGFGTIGKLFPTKWNWEIFWQMTALLSIILAFMNILPIPALDGGHVMFLVYEMVTGKPPSDKFLTSAQLVGMTLLFGLLIYANGMDIYRWIIE
jgi:regulator of sigma E protease